MQIFQQLAGYSLGQADMIRRAMSKKKAKEVEKEREAFLRGDPERGITGCVKNGIPEDIAQSIYNRMDFCVTSTSSHPDMLVYGCIGPPFFAPALC